MNCQKSVAGSTAVGWRAGSEERRRGAGAHRGLPGVQAAAGSATDVVCQHAAAGLGVRGSGVVATADHGGGGCGGGAGGLRRQASRCVRDLPGATARQRTGARAARAAGSVLAGWPVALAASALLATVLLQQRSQEADEVVAAHVRSLLGESPE